MIKKSKTKKSNLLVLTGNKYNIESIYRKDK